MVSLDVNLVTQKIIGCAYEVSNTLGTGFVEKVYENALAHQIRKSASFSVAQQHPIKVSYDGVVVGEFFADMLVQEKVIVELKAVSMLKDEHIAQALNYLRASGLEICLLINFGQSKIEIKRLRSHHSWKKT
ncbi:MAG: GxxExxY protein [Anaerolineales bacterium]|nr:GxxExxY protein [Anaerolineales bacterium]